jgi:SAM-dependent methyltransferase
MIAAPPAAGALPVYERALHDAAAGRRAALTLVDDLGREVPLDPAAWCRARLPGDGRLLHQCSGPTLDVGCGPGRLTAALLRQGVPALGIDVSPAAVRLARQRGATVLCRDVFAALPGHGRWRHLLLADGNIGIGGDPVVLLRRCRELLTAGGRVHTEVAPPGTRSWAGRAVLRSAGGDAAPLRWAAVAADDLAAVAGDAALRTLGTWTEAGRWFATLTAR